jgi:16S rRNA (guanine527-N7)-methyltransferase
LHPDNNQPDTPTSTPLSDWPTDLWPQWWATALLLWPQHPLLPLPTPSQQAQLQAMAQTLFGILHQTNQHTNLTRLTSPQQYLERHVLDSLTLLQPLLTQPHSTKPLSIIDVGSGAGFPALVLAMVASVYPHTPLWHVTALEATHKKAQFIKQATDTLGLSKYLNVVADRAEAFANTPRGKRGFDVVTARAVAPLPKLIPWCAPLLKPTGVLLALKGAKAPDELLTASDTLRQWCLLHTHTDTFNHINGLEQAVILHFKKR